MTKNIYDSFSKIEKLAKEYLKWLNEDRKKKITMPQLMAWVGNDGYGEEQIEWLERCIQDGIIDCNDTAEDIGAEILRYNKR